MAAPSTFVRIRLNPIAGGRLPFPAQLVLGLVMAAYAGAALLTGSDPTAARAHPLLHGVFMGFALAYLAYVIGRSAPLFGTQSYLEFTPDYLVHKHGLFRPKVAFGAEEIAHFELSDRQLRIVPKAGVPHDISLRQVRGPRKRARLRAGLEAFAQRHGLAVQQG